MSAIDKAERFRRLMSTEALKTGMAGRSVRAAMFTASAGFADFALRIGSMALLARLVVPEHFGLVMMVTAVIAVADQLRELGLSTATVQRPEISHQEVTNLFWVNAGFGALLAIAIAAAAPAIAAYYQDPRLEHITALLASTLLFGGLTVQHQALLTRQLKVGHAAFVRLASSVVSTLLAIALAWYGWGYWALLWREVARTALLGGGMWWCMPWLPGLPSRETDIRELLRFGANLTGANLITIVSTGFDRFLLGRLWGAAPVAIYRQGYQLVSAPTDQLLSPLYQVTQPALCVLQSDPARYRRFYLNLLTLVSAVTMPLSMFVAVYADLITSLLLGPAWMSAAPVVFILSFSAFIKQPVSSAGFVLITRGRSGSYLSLTAAHNLTLVLLMCVGIRWGFYGIAWAEVATTYLLIVPRLYYCLRGSPIAPRMLLSRLARPLSASIFMAYSLVALRWVSESLIAGVVVAFVAFCCAWAMLPGGMAEFQAIFSDLRSALKKKVSPAGSIEVLATAN